MIPKWPLSCHTPSTYGSQAGETLSSHNIINMACHRWRIWFWPQLCISPDKTNISISLFTPATATEEVSYKSYRTHWWRIMTLLVTLLITLLGWYPQRTEIRVWRPNFTTISCLLWTKITVWGPEEDLQEEELLYLLHCLGHEEPSQFPPLKRWIFPLWGQGLKWPRIKT